VKPPSPPTATPSPPPSPYFKALLQNWTCSEARRITLEVSGPGERAAAEMMLRAAYSGAAPGNATPEQLLSCMVLADRCGPRRGGGCEAGGGREQGL
jgi:hypothetical protein